MRVIASENPRTNSVRKRNLPLNLLKTSGCPPTVSYKLRRFLIQSAARVAGVRIPSKHRRCYAAQILRELPSQRPAARTDWTPTFEELFLVDPLAFTPGPVASTSATTLDDLAERPRKFVRARRQQDPDGLPLATDPTVLDDASLTSVPEPQDSLLTLPPVRKRDGKERARDADWLTHAWSTPEWARLSLRTRPAFEQVAEGHPYYDEIMRYKMQSVFRCHRSIRR